MIKNNIAKHLPVNFYLTFFFSTCLQHQINGRDFIKNNLPLMQNLTAFNKN